MGVNNWSRDPDANGVADPTIAANDGASARHFPRSLRGAMASVRKLADDQSGAITSSGGPNAYVVRTFSGLTELRAGLSLSFVAHRGNSGPPSLSVDGHGALPLLNRDGGDLPAGYLKAGRLVRVIYVASPPSWRTIDLGVVANEDLVQAPARTIKGNAGDGLDDIPVADARVLLAVDKLPNKTEAELAASLAASGPIADAIAESASAEAIAEAVAPIPGLIAAARQDAIASASAASSIAVAQAVAPIPNLIESARQGVITTVVGDAPDSANTLGKLNTLVADKASIAQTTSLQSALILMAAAFADGSARQIRTYTGQ